jgi:MoxR-like ATPase
MGYPSPTAELDMLASHGSSSPLDSLTPVADADDINRLISVARAVHVADEVQRYVVDLVVATRSHPDLRLGASPRAALHLLRTARATAALDGRTFVVPDDVQDLAGPVLTHRLLPTAEAQIARRLPEDVIRELIGQLPVSAYGAGRSDAAGRRGAAPLWPNG